MTGQVGYSIGGMHLSIHYGYCIEGMHLFIHYSYYIGQMLDCCIEVMHLSIHYAVVLKGCISQYIMALY